MGHQMLLTDFTPTDPYCHGNKIPNKMGYTSACTTNIIKILASDRGAG